MGTDTLFIYRIGQYVLRRSRSVGKLAPRMDGPFRITGVAGRMFQRITMVGTSGRALTCHASKLVLFSGPVDESTWAPPRHAAREAPEPAAEVGAPPPTRVRKRTRS